MKTRIVNNHVCIFDDEDYRRFEHVTLRVVHGYIQTRDYLTIQRLILNAPPDKQVDHIDGNRLNNCRSNLRLCSQSENMANRRRQKNNVSGFKGVSWYSRFSLWRAQINKDNRNLIIGYFPTALSAAMAYDIAAKNIHAEFALLNFPDAIGL